MSKLETLLSRSGSLPLRIHFWTEDEIEMNEDEIPMVNLLARHAARWEHLRIGGAEEFYTRIQHIGPQLHMLRTLEFDLLFDIPPDSALDIFSQAPKLEVVSSGMVFWKDPVPLDLPWPQLSKYRTAMDWVTLPSLASATNLVECSLDLGRDSGGGHDDIQRLSFPHLVRLSVTSTAVLACSDMPALTELYYHQCEECNDFDFDVTAFLNVVPRTVQKLVLEINAATLDLTSVVAALPAIKYFAFMEDLPVRVVCDFLRSPVSRAPALERVALAIDNAGGVADFYTLLETSETMDWAGAARGLRSLAFHINSLPSPKIKRRLEVLQERGVDVGFDETYSHFYTNSVPEFLRIVHNS